MRKHNTQPTDTHLQNLENNLQEEGSGPVKEQDQRFQETHVQLLQRHENIRLFILSVGLLAIMLSAVLFFFMGSVDALFGTIVAVPLFYWCVNVYLNKSDAFTT